MGRGCVLVGMVLFIFPGQKGHCQEPSQKKARVRAPVFAHIVSSLPGTMEEAHQQEMELWGSSHHGPSSEIMSGTTSVLINHKHHLSFHSEMDDQALVFHCMEVFFITWGGTSLCELVP